MYYYSGQTNKEKKTMNNAEKHCQITENDDQLLLNDFIRAIINFLLKLDFLNFLKILSPYSVQGKEQYLLRNTFQGY